MLLSLALAGLLTRTVDMPKTPAANALAGELFVGLSYDRLKEVFGPPKGLVLGGLGNPVMAEYWYQIDSFVIRVHVTFFQERVSSARCSIRREPKVSR